VRSFLTILLLLCFKLIPSAQTASNITLETEFFTIEFPGIPEFKCDTIQDSLLIVKHAYFFEGADEAQFSIVYRDRMKNDNKHDTFQAEMDWLSYWTLPQISQEKKGKLNGHPTFSFQANTESEIIQFLYILTPTHFIRIETGSESEKTPEVAQHFFDSFKLKE